MNCQFPIFKSHLDLAHRYWEQLLSDGGWAIDATCGNGKDTCKLAHILSPFYAHSGILALDIQPQAIAATQAEVQAQFPAENPLPIHYFCQSHADFPPLAAQQPIRLIVYNLGYLPKGNKEITTLTSSTLESLLRAMQLVIPGGAISITCYPGHSEGAREQEALLLALEQIPPQDWNICYHRFPNRKESPTLLLLQKAKN